MRLEGLGAGAGLRSLYVSNPQLNNFIISSLALRKSFAHKSNGKFVSKIGARYKRTNILTLYIPSKKKKG
jgi:hypothetical protein